MAEKLNDLIAARTEKPAPAGADKIPLLDSADANKFRWLSWSGLLARLSALFDPAGTASAAVSTHLAAADPHPTYTTAAELASAISAKADASHTQAASTITDFSEAVDDRVAALLVAGTNVTLNYNDSAGTLTVASSGGAGYTDEQAQDAVGGILTDSPTVDFTYDDAANTITAATKSQQSITSDASGLKLVGDAAAPGNSQMYGTNASGAKGWYTQPSAPVQSVAGRTGAVTLAAADIGGLGGAATLGVGDVAGTVAAGNHAHAGVYDSAGTAAAAVATHAALPQTHGISAFGATLVDDASAAAARATLGLGTAATLNAGTTASALVQLDAAAKLPAIDGSQLTGLPSGVSVHASLGGLASDDHPQYYNQARGDARYSQTSHSHAGVYEPAGAISTHAATAQVHGISAFGSTLVDDASATAARATLGLGTVATLNVGVAAGNIPQLDGSARLPAVDGSLLTGLATPAPRIVTVPAATGVVTADLANASRVVVKMTQTGPISAITPQNVPTVCDVRYEITQGAGGPWSLPQSAWAPAVASAYYVYPAGTTVFWWNTTDGGATATLECNAPLSLSLSQANAAGTIVVDAAGVGEVVVNLTLTGDITGITRQNIPTNCLIRYETTQGAGGPWVIKDSAWGSGASVDPYLTATTGKTVIVWSTSDGGTTATVSGPAKGVYDPAGTASSAVSAHVAAGNPHTQYALESALGGAAALNVGTAAGTVAAGNDARFIAQASAQYVLLARSSAGAGAWQEITSSANLYSFLQAATYAAAKTLLSLNNVANVDQLPRTAEVVTVTGNTTVDSTYNGKIIDCNSASAITLTFNDSLTAGFQCYVLRRGAGTVAIARQTSGTLNGAATSISVSAQWKSAFVFAYGTGTFAVDAG